MPLSKDAESDGTDTDGARSQIYRAPNNVDGTFRRRGISVEEFQALRRGFGAKRYAADYRMGFCPQHPETSALSFVSRAIPPPFDTPQAAGRCRQDAGRPKRYRRG